MTTLAPNLFTLLSTIAAGHAFHNPKSPLVKALERDGLIAGNAAVKNPVNGEQIAYGVTAKGAALLPPAVIAAAEEADGTEEAETTGQDETGEGVQAATEEPPPVKAKRHRSPNLARELVIVHSGARMPIPSGIGAITPKDGREKYPFATLAAPEIGADGVPMCDSFFIKSTPTLPDPARSLGSHVSKANKKYKEAGRFFKIFPVEDDHEHHVPGARVMRIDKAAVA